MNKFSAVLKSNEKLLYSETPDKIANHFLKSSENDKTAALKKFIFWSNGLKKLNITKYDFNIETAKKILSSNNNDKPWNEIQKYNGMDVDKEMNQNIMDRLNSKTHIISVCSGHPKDSKLAIDAGASEYPHFIFSVYNPRDFEKTVEYIKSKLKSKDTKINAHAWGGPYGNWVVWNDKEGWRNHKFPEDPQKYKIDHISITVESTIAHNGKNQKMLNNWWELITNKLEELDNI